jgi:phosphate-selective porin
MRSTFMVRTLLLAVVSLSVWKPPAHAASKELDRLINLLIDKKVITLDEAAALRADIAVEEQEAAEKKKDFNVTAKRPLTLSGYSQFQFRSAVEDDQGKRFADSLFFRRGRLSLGGKLTDEVDYKLQVELTGSRKVLESVDFTRQTSKSATVGRPVVLDLALGYQLPRGMPGGRIVAGQFKIPFSQENLISSSDLETINRSQLGEQLVPGRDIGSQGRDVGALFSVTVPNADGERIAEYAVGVFNGSGINVSDDNDAKDVALRAVVYPQPGLSAGLSGYFGKVGVGRLDHRRVGAEAAWARGPWWVKSEYVQGRGNGKDDERKKQGWYLLAGYNLTVTRQLLLRYDTFDPDRDAGKDRSTVLTVGANWRLTPWSRLQVNYELKNEQGPEVSNNALLAQYQVKF